MQPSVASASVGHQRLQLLQRTRLRWFFGFEDPKLEADYGGWLRLERAVARQWLLLVPLVALLSAPFYGYTLLDTTGPQNAEHVLWLRIIEFGFCVPACLASLFVLRRWPGRPISTHVFLVGFVVVFVGLAAIRWITASDGGALPAELVMLAPLALASIAGVRNHLLLPTLWFGSVFYFFAEMAVHEGPMLARALLGIVVMTWISVMNALVVDRLSRRAWLDRRIAELSGMIDGITALPNRAWFNRDAAALLRQLYRQPVPLAVYLIDLDHFKKLNDAHGHVAGDAALAAVGEMLLREYARRPLDLVARYGGEEFVMTLHDVTREHAERVAAELVAAVHALRIPNRSTPQGRLTASVGVWQGLPSKERPVRMEDLLAEADAALYAAKDAGRNRYVVAGGPSSPQAATATAAANAAVAVQSAALLPARPLR